MKSALTAGSRYSSIGVFEPVQAEQMSFHPT